MKAELWTLIATSLLLVPQFPAQEAVKPAENVTRSTAVHSSPSPTKAPEAQTCQKFADRDWPIRSTLQARVAYMMDAAHLKPGKEVYARAMYPVRYPDCTLEDNAVLYGHVIAASYSKQDKSSELDLVFDHADCAGHERQPVRLRLIGIIAPLERSDRLHSALPSEVAGGVMQLPPTDLEDENLSPDFFPRTVHPGLVNRIPNATLEPEGGPECSARISGSDRPLQLVPGTALIMTIAKMTQPK